MIYKGLNRTGMIGDIKTNGGGEIAEVYGGIGDSNPIYYKQRDMVGTSPMQFKALGLPLKDYRIYGETLQDGTPSPDMPVDVVGCGVRTENLFDAATAYGSMYDSATGVLVGAAKTLATMKNKFTSSMVGVPITISMRVYDVPVTRVFIRCTIGGTNIDSNSIANGNTGTMTVTVTPTSVNDDWRITFGTGTGDLTLSNLMLNLGSTALPYEPYGYKLPVTTTNGTNTVTTPIYVGSEPIHRIGKYADYVGYSSGKIMRRIKKLVLTGNENWILYTLPDAVNVERFYFVLSQLAVSSSPDNLVSSHFPIKSNNSDMEHMRCGGSSNNEMYIYIPRLLATTVAGLKSYLAAKYTAGTPVTVWYVLETPTEEDPPVPFPELTTLSGTNTLTVDTTVKPSRIDLTGRLKAYGYGQLLDKNLTAINDSTGTPIFVRG